MVSSGNELFSVAEDAGQLQFEAGTPSRRIAGCGKAQDTHPLDPRLSVVPCQSIHSRLDTGVASLSSRQ